MRDRTPDKPRHRLDELRLPYRITDQDGVEIGCAASPSIALAMFRSALSEHSHRSLILSKNGHLLIERFV